MYISIGLGVLAVAAAVVYTLSKTWPILERFQHVSRDVEDTTHEALRGPVRTVLRVLNAISSKGGDRNDK